MNKISIIIPCYGQAQYLPNAIESALNQTVKAHEIIVVNDGSKDGSLEIAKSYENKGIKVIDQVNKGLASARNTGIMNSTGDYILPLDADDMLVETAIEEITKRIEETEADIVAPSFKCYGLSNETIILNGDGLIAKSFIYANRLGYFSAYKRSKALEIGGYSPKMVEGYEDLHFWIDMFKRGASISVIQKPLVLYQVKANSMIHEAQANHDKLMAQIYKDHQAVYES